MSISRSLVSDDDGDGEGMAVCWRQRRRETNGSEQNWLTGCAIIVVDRG